MDSWLNLGAAALALLAGLLGLTQYLNFKTKRQRQAEVGQAFASVVSGLGSQSSVERLANAALVRRFFDEKSEFGQGGRPYADDAVRVIGAVLRTEATGPVQKLLGDGLGAAHSLKYGDLQKANLRNCYLGRGKDDPQLDVSGADLYGADLTGASLRRANLHGAQFRDANLTACVLRDANCTGANFNGANLRGAQMEGALLDGASFLNASNIPEAVTLHLDATGTFRGTVPLVTEARTKPANAARRVFISAPSALDELDAAVLEQIAFGAEQAHWDVIRHLPNQYNRADPIAGILKEMAKCQAAIVFGPPQLRAKEASLCRGSSGESVTNVVLPSPWNQVEAGMAVALGVPVLIVRRQSSGGVFDLVTTPPVLETLDLDQPGSLRDLANRVERWCQSADTVATL